MEALNPKSVTLNTTSSVCVPVGGNSLNENLQICTNAITSIPVSVPATDSFFPYVQRAETAASNAEAAAQAAQEIVNSLPSDITDLQNAFSAVQSANGEMTFTRINGTTQAVHVSASSVGNLSVVQRNSAYQIGDVAYSFSIPSWGFLICQAAGITANTAPAFPQTEGDIYSDGSTVWMLCRKKEEPTAEF